MANQNDKKVIRAARDLLVVALSNLLKSERERKFAYKTKAGPKRRKTFCNKFNLTVSTVAWIETGRILGLRFEQLRPYLAALREKDEHQYLLEFRRLYDGLKAIDVVLKDL